MNRNEVKRRQAQMISILIFMVNFLLYIYKAGFNGVAYLMVPLFVYWFFVILLNGNIVGTLSRLIKLRISKGQVRNAVKMERDAFVFQLFSALIPMLIMIFAATPIAVYVFKMPLSDMMLRIFGISLLFRTVTCSVLSIAKGENVELPCVTTDVLRQVLLLVIQIPVCRYLADYGAKVSELLGLTDYVGMYAGIGFALSCLAAEMLACIYSAVIFFRIRKSRKKEQQEGTRTSVSFGDNVKTVCGNRIPAMAVLLPVWLPFVLGLLFIQKAGNSEADVIVKYGTMISAISVVPVILMALFTVSVIPVCGKVVAFLRKDEQKYARTTFQGGVHIGAVKAFFYTSFVAVESYRIAGILFKTQAEVIGKYLRLAALFLLAGCLAFYFAEFLILTGKRILVLSTLAIVDVVFVLLLTLILNKTDDMMMAFLYSLDISGYVLAISLGTICYKKLRISIDAILYLILPGATAATTGIICMFIDKLITPHMGDLVSFFLCYLISISLYWTFSLVLRGFNSKELEEFPGNRLVIALGQMLHAI